MTVENYNTTLISAEGDNYLTQFSDVPLNERIVATRVALSKYSTPDQWKEISKAEGDEIIAQQNQARIAEAPTD